MWINLWITVGTKNNNTLDFFFISLYKIVMMLVLILLSQFLFALADSSSRHLFNHSCGFWQALRNPQLLSYILLRTAAVGVLSYAYFSFSEAYLSFVTIIKVFFYLLCIALFNALWVKDRMNKYDFLGLFCIACALFLNGVL